MRPISASNPSGSCSSFLRANRTTSRRAPTSKSGVRGKRRREGGKGRNTEEEVMGSGWFLLLSLRTPTLFSSVGDEKGL